MTDKTENKPTFEEAMKHLEAIVRDLQSGSAPLEKSLALFKEGTALVDYCTGLLDNLKVFISRLFSSLSLICVLIYNSWQLSIIAIVVLGCALLPLASVKRRIKFIVLKNVTEASKVFTNYNETYSGAKTIYSYNLQQKI